MRPATVRKPRPEVTRPIQRLPVVSSAFMSRSGSFDSASLTPKNTGAQVKRMPMRAVPSPAHAHDFLNDRVAAPAAGRAVDAIAMTSPPPFAETSLRRESGSQPRPLGSVGQVTHPLRPRSDFG